MDRLEKFILENKPTFLEDDGGGFIDTKIPLNFEEINEVHLEKDVIYNEGHSYTLWIFEMKDSSWVVVDGFPLGFQEDQEFETYCFTRNTLEEIQSAVDAYWELDWNYVIEEKE